MGEPAISAQTPSDGTTSAAALAQCIAFPAFFLGATVSDRLGLSGRCCIIRGHDAFCAHPPPTSGPQSALAAPSAALREHCAHAANLGVGGLTSCATSLR